MACVLTMKCDRIPPKLPDIMIKMATVNFLRILSLVFMCVLGIIFIVFSPLAMHLAVGIDKTTGPQCKINLHLESFSDRNRSQPHATYDVTRMHAC